MRPLPEMTRLDEEVQAHLALLAADFEQQGLSPAEAMLAARKAFGGVQQMKEVHLDQRGGRWLLDVRADLVYAVRSLVRTPAFASVAVLTLALGIGANTAIFSIINGLFMRALPVTEPEQLVELRGVPGGLAGFGALVAATDIFTGVASHELTQFNLGSGVDAEWVDGLWASARLLDVAGVRLAAGRGFVAADDQPAGGPDGDVAIISHRLWQRRFGGAPGAIGQRLTLNRIPVTIIGVTPPEFFGLVRSRSFDVMVPMRLRARMFSEELFGPDIGRTVARLRRGLDADSAAASLRRAHPQIREAMAHAGLITDAAEMERPIRLSVLGSPDDPSRASPYARPLTILMVLVGFVLLIACANLANLLMARATARRQELAVRRALGATRWRLIRQLLAEAGVVAAAGAAAGIVFAIWASRLLVGMFGDEAAFAVGRRMYGAANLSLDLPLDWRVLAFTGAVTVVTVLLFGAAPALIGSRVMPMHALKEHGQNTPDRRPAAYAGAVIAAQVAVSLVLLVGATLLVRTFTSVTDVELGFEPDRVLAVDADAPRGDPRAALAAYERAVETIRRVPGVEAAGLSEGALFGGLFSPVTASGLTDITSVRPVGPDWLTAIGARILSGRGITRDDRAGAPGVAMVNQTFARRFFGGASPIGQVVIAGDPSTGPVSQAVVVGLVQDFVPSARERPQSQLFLPIAQVDPDTDYLAIALEEEGLTMLVRASAGSPLQLRRAVSEALSLAHPELALTFRPMRAELNGLLTQERVLALLSGFFGLLGLGLAAIGLYGVTSYTVGRQQRELGIRLAIGARRASLIGIVLGRAAVLIAGGIAAGTVASLWLSQFLVALLFGVEPQDRLVLLGSAATLLAVGVLAAALPAWRASRIDPAIVLRDI